MKFSKSVANFPRDSLSFQRESPDGDQLPVAIHAFGVPFLTWYVHPHGLNWCLDVGLYNVPEIFKNQS